MIKYSIGAELNRWGPKSSTMHLNLYNGTMTPVRRITDPVEILHLSKAEEERLWDIVTPQYYGLAKFILENEK